MSTKNISSCDVCWLIADWAWDKTYNWLITKSNDKKVVATVHHIVPEKFDKKAALEFQQRDKYVDVYHVFNKYAKDQVELLTSKPIIEIPYWGNQFIWKSDISKFEARKNLNLDQNSFIISSMQRDTEGHDLKSPKLEKGPDLFIEAVKKYHSINPKVHVLLGGWRRQYVIKNLNDANIPFTFIEKPPQKIINTMYLATDLYLVTARHEGGPQSLIECGLTGTPVVSRDIGIAYQVLPKDAISNNVFDAVPHIPNVEHMKIPQAFKQYRDFFQSL